MFTDIDYILHPRALPASVQDILRKDCQPSYLSILLHNYMISFHKEDRYVDRLSRFTASGFDLIHKLQKLLQLHHHTYFNRGHIPFYELHGLKPTGALGDRFKELGISGFSERVHLMSCVKTIHYLLEARSDFNQTFPAETLAGILVDIDAIRKDELPPSYVDWPGKYDLHKVGMFPDHDTVNKLFDSFKFADFKIDRMWDHWHPSPSKKKLNQVDYCTPVRRTMQKNALVKDQQGQFQARKGALKKVETDYETIEKRCENEITEHADERIDIDMENADVVKEGRAAFIDSPVAFYMHAINTPVQKSKIKHKAPMTPFPSQIDRSVAVEPVKAAEHFEDPPCAVAVEPVKATEHFEEPPHAADAVQVIQSFKTLQSTRPVEPAPVINALPAADTLPAAAGLDPVITENAPPAAVCDDRVTQDAVRAVECKVAAVSFALPVTKANVLTVVDDGSIAGDAFVTDDEHEPDAVASRLPSHWR